MCGAFFVEEHVNVKVWSSGSTQQRITVTTSGNYSVQVTTPDLCSAQFSTAVIVRAEPTVNLGSDRTICFGESVQLDAGNAGGTFLWSTGAVTKTIQARTNGTYWVDVRVSNGCVKRDSVFIEVRPEIVNALPAVYNLCPNESRVLDATSPQAVSYQWFNSAGLISSNPQLNIMDDGRYWVVMKDIFNCSSTDTVNIITDPDPITSRFLVATFVNTGDSVKFVQLSYPDPVLFAWDFKDGITSTASDPYHIYLRGGDFDASLMVTDPNSCSDTKSKVITVRFVRPDDELEIEVPFVEIIRSILYPNPTSGKMNLDIKLNQETEIMISIYSVNGKFIQSKKITLKDTEVEFDVSQFAKGVYILKVSINNDERLMKFVKM